MNHHVYVKTSKVLS